MSGWELHQLCIPVLLTSALFIICEFCRSSTSIIWALSREVSHLNTSTAIQVSCGWNKIGSCIDKPIEYQQTIFTHDVILTHTLILCSHVLISEDKAIITFFTFSSAINWFITTFLAVCNLGQCFTCWKWQSMTLLDWWCDIHLEDYIRQHWLFMSYVPVHSPFSFLPNPAEQVEQEVAEEQTSQLLGHSSGEIQK